MMQRRGTPLSVLVMLAAIAAAGCAAAPPAASQAERTGTASDRVAAAKEEGMPVLLLVDTGDRPLGAYELVLRYDPAVVKVLAVASAEADMGEAAFRAAPMSNPSTYVSGSTPIVGFQTAGPVKAGSVPVAVAFLDAVKPGTSSVSVSVRALYDPDGVAIPGTAKADPDSVHVNP